MFNPTATPHNLVSARNDFSGHPELAGGANV